MFARVLKLLFCRERDISIIAVCSSCSVGPSCFWPSIRGNNIHLCEYSSSRKHRIGSEVPVSHPWYSKDFVNHEIDVRGVSVEQFDIESITNSRASLACWHKVAATDTTKSLESAFYFSSMALQDRTHKSNISSQDIT